MSIHSPTTASITPVRVPKLKVRNRLPPEAALSQESLHLKASAGPYATTLEQYDDTSTMTLYHSASSSLSRASPTSSASSNSPPAKMHRSATRSRGAEHARDAQDYQFLYTVPGAPGEPDAIHPLFQTRDPLSTWPNHASRTHSGRDDQPAYAALTEQNLASRDSQSSMMSGSGKKRGKMGLLGVITLKEPSALALEQFADAQRRQAQLKGSRGSTAGTSDRKLPLDVPKVNSKWDGLPNSSRDAAKSSKRDKKQGDSFWGRMPDSRRPASVSNSVTTFSSREGHVPPRLYIPASQGCPDATDRPVTTSTAKTGSPPSSSHPTSNSSRVRTRAGSAVASSKKSGKPNSSHSTAATSMDVPPPGRTFFLPDSPVEGSKPIPNPSATNLAAGIFPLTPTSPAAMQRQRHKPRRSVSDPRLAVGMDNVAPLLSFLGNEGARTTTPPASPAASTPTARRIRPAVQVYWSASTQSFIPIHTPTTPVSPFSETLGPNPPPIPRRSSRRASSDSVPQAEAIMRSLAALTAPQPLPKEITFPEEVIEVPPSPPPKPAQYVQQTPPSVPRAHVRAIFPPPDMAERGGAPVKRTLESVLASGTAVAGGSWISPHHANAGLAPATPTARVRPAVSVRTTGRHRSNSASAASPPEPPRSSSRSASRTRRPSLAAGEGNGLGLMHAHAHAHTHHTLERGPSASPASYTASELSEQWFRSPRERLGLGVVKKDGSSVGSVPWNADAVGVGESAASANASPSTPVATKSDIVPWERDVNANYGAEGDAVWDAAVKQMEGSRGDKDGGSSAGGSTGKRRPRWSGFGKRKDDGRIVW